MFKKLAKENNILAFQVIFLEEIKSRSGNSFSSILIFPLYLKNFCLYSIFFSLGKFFGRIKGSFKLILF